MIYDTFLYDGEEEMLKLRIDTLKDVVDCFVPVRGSKTFRGNKKEDVRPIHCGRLSDRYSVRVAWLDLPCFSDPWLSEFWHRNHALTVMPDLKPSDMVLIGDVDEIPDPSNVKHLGAHCMEFYYYSARWSKGCKWIGTVGVLGETLLSGMLPSNLRMMKDELSRIQGGWHLSYFFMDAIAIRDKIRAFSHQEFDKPEFTDLESIQTRMNQGLDLFDRGEDCVWLDTPSSYLPEALKANPPGF